MSTPHDLVSVEHQPPEGRVTFEEYLAWADEDTLAEWVDGEIQLMSPTSNRDQRLVIFLVKVLGLWIELHGLGELRSETFLMRLSGRVRRGRLPDLLFVARDHLDRIGPTYVDGPADLVIEIVSPDSTKRDREDKLREYEQGGVLEYWIIDPMRQEADFYELAEAGRFRLAHSGRGGIYHSRVVAGFWLDVEWLWQDPLPATLEVLGQLGLRPR